MSESDKHLPKKESHQRNGFPLDGVQFPNESFPLGNDRNDESKKINVTERARLVPVPPKPSEKPPKK